MNQGHSGKLKYDNDTIQHSIQQSVQPGHYKLEQYQNHNCDGCLTSLGPIGKNGVSTAVPSHPAMSQQLVDVETMLSNRDVKASKSKNGRTNLVDINKIKLIHHNECDSKLNPQYSHLSYPTVLSREMPTNRFHNLPKDPQSSIRWERPTNSVLHAKDNFVPVLPTPLDDHKILPIASKLQPHCEVKCGVDPSCKK